MDPKIQKEGSLEKKSRWIGAWRDRWTVLSAPNEKQNYYTISTYKSEKTYHGPTEEISNELIKMIKRKLCFM